MPSPLAHAAMGYAIYRLYHPHLSQKYADPQRLEPRLLLTTVGLSLLPDSDSALGILMGDFGRYHNNATHSLVVGLAVALAIGGIVWLTKHAKFVTWFTLTLICYELHVLMDYFTVGRGVMLFWPFSSLRYSSSLKLFYGLHWSDGLFSQQHLWTLVTELAFVVCIVGLVRLFPKRAKQQENL
jgi:inner membrane protein